MKIKRFLAFAIAAAVMAVAVVLSLPCFAAYIGTISAADWWNTQASSCSLFAYSSSGAILNTPVPVNKSAFISRTYDISPYVSWTSVTSGYITSRYACIESTFSPLPAGASMYGFQLQFSDSWSLISGRTYEFVILRNSIAFYNAAGEPVSTGTQVHSVSLGGLAMTLEDVKLSSDMYDRAIRCTVTPSSNVTVKTISIFFKSMYNPSVAASKVILNVGFSDVVSYTGNLDNVVVNPTLNNIDKQVGEINDKLDGIKGSPDDTATVPDIMPGIHDKDSDLDAIESGELQLAKNLDDFMSMLNVPDGTSFWSTLGGFFHETDTINALFWWGDRYGECLSFSMIQVILYFSGLCVVLAVFFGCCRWGYYRIKVRESSSAKSETASVGSDDWNIANARRGKAMQVRENNKKR